MTIYYDDTALAGTNHRPPNFGQNATPGWADDIVYVAPFISTPVPPIIVIDDTHDGVDDKRRSRKFREDREAVRRTIENIMFGPPESVPEAIQVEALQIAAPYIEEREPDWVGMFRDHKVINDLLELNRKLVEDDDREIEELFILPFLH